MIVGTLRHLATRVRARRGAIQWRLISTVLGAALLAAGCAGEPVSTSGLLTLAGNQAAQGHCPQAITTYSKVLGTDATNLVALQGRGTCYGQLGEYAQAISDYSAVTRMTASATDLVSLATYEWDAGFTSQATSHLATASRLAGQNDNVAELLTIAGLQLGYSASAGAALTLRRIPASGRLSVWYLLSGRLAASESDVPAMTSDFAVAVRLSPTSQLAPALVTEANAFWTIGYYGTAIATYQRALASEGAIDRAQVYVQMGYAYDRLGSLQTAIGAYRSALNQGLAGGARQATEYAIAADFVALKQLSEARTALAPLLHASLLPALRDQVNALEAVLSAGG